MANRLGNETSPYLLQHAANPVHWHAWNDDALALARESGRPILLSIGYSACHWCHVMAHESFEDADTAKLMNRLYVNVKVDREERPDIDKIYQLAHQLFTGRPGGWPLTVFLTPDRHLPIMVGTYFPKEPRYGMPAFRQLLERVADHYREHADEIETQGEALIAAFRRIDAATAGNRGPVDDALFAAARAALDASFDARHGGFGGAPKFPRATNLELALELWHDSIARGGEDTTALHIVTHTLDAMAKRGLYDQLGGGFYRYCVDDAWAIPHFEKMLYDNASLLALYADAWAATGERGFATVAEETAAWLTRDMRAPAGGWYAALDADSEGEEGRFYLWTPAEFDAVLEPREARAAKSAFGLYGPANFEGSHWHLHRAESTRSIADAGDAGVDEIEQLLASAKAKLLAARNARPWPGRDDKQLVSWNALTIRAMARAGRRLHRPEYLDEAEAAVDFIRATLWTGERLNAVYKDGRSRFPAYLDDHAFLIDALLELLQGRWRTDDLNFAIALADVLLARFADPRGGFFFVADDHEQLIHRPRSFADEAAPSGNGVALGALLLLGHLLGETRYLDAADLGLRAALPLLENHPDAHATVLRALALHQRPPTLVIVRGDAESLATWRERFATGYHPRRFMFFVPAGETALPGLLADRGAPGSGPTAWLCRGTTCLAPMSDPEELAAALAEAPAQ
jgi:uncharacterized protein